MVDSDAPVEFALSYASLADGRCFRATRQPAVGCSCSVAECNSPGKHPRLVNGLRGATTEPSEIDAWWRRWPDANVAIRTGAESGLVVIDIDRRGGGDRTLAALVQQHGRMACTRL